MLLCRRCQHPHAFLSLVQASKGLSVALQSLWAQQTGRGVLRKLLEAERKKGAHLGSSLEGKDARLHDLDATVSNINRLVAYAVNQG